MIWLKGLPWASEPTTPLDTPPMLWPQLEFSIDHGFVLELSLVHAMTHQQWSKLVYHAIQAELPVASCLS